MHMPSGSRLITVDARPEPVQFEAGRCAVLVVDMQNDFGARGGMFDRAGIDIAPIERAVGPTARALDVARAAGLPVIYLVMQFRPALSDAGAPDSPNRIKHAPLGLGAEVPASGRLIAVLDLLARLMVEPRPVRHPDAGGVFLIEAVASRQACASRRRPMLWT
jgi:ureidoacrylate peracid hydrolase